MKLRTIVELDRAIKRSITALNDLGTLRPLAGISPTVGGRSKLSPPQIWSRQEATVDGGSDMQGEVRAPRPSSSARW